MQGFQVRLSWEESLGAEGVVLESCVVIRCMRGSKAVWFRIDFPREKKGLDLVAESVDRISSI